MCLLFSLLGSKLSFAYNKEDFHQKYFWETEAKIVLCDDAKITKLKLLKAIWFWNKVGFEVSANIVEKKCESEHQLGEIRVTNQRDLDLQKYYGFTERKMLDTTLLAATIKIADASSDNLKLIIHELGHALGIQHTHFDKSHIMNPYVMEEDTRFD